jgi:hypothetical protein
MVRIHTLQLDDGFVYPGQTCSLHARPFYNVRPCARTVLNLARRVQVLLRIPAFDLGVFDDTVRIRVGAHDAALKTIGA